MKVLHHILGLVKTAKMWPEILQVVMMNSDVAWDMTCSLLDYEFKSSTFFRNIKPHGAIVKDRVIFNNSIQFSLIKVQRLIGQLQN
jgi:hypothetical protein